MNVQAAEVAASDRSTTAPLLQIENLKVDFATEHGWHTVVNGVSFAINADEIVGLVGESGSGKTVTGLSVLGLIPTPPGRITGGRIMFEGEDLTKASTSHMRHIRGDAISMVFQEPMTSLNPAFTIGDQIAETYRQHRGGSRKAAKKRAVEVLDLVGIPNAVQRLCDYPHEFSGGMRQRVMIAMALVCEPRLLIADEPTTALDVTVQAQILDLLRDLRSETGMGVVFVTHDLGVVAETCDRVIVMYAGEVIETASTRNIFTRPRHPYTEGLITAMPQLGDQHGKLATIPGSTPEPWAMPPGCRFEPRCKHSVAACQEHTMRLRDNGSGSAACIRVDELHLQGAR
ncbi:ABC transporter ATP-binding protein [Rhodococcus sp. NPDC127530]|uniref:ABC transporter ATP-binding protein n=1 Tax=unclassified Rhodococcus (in: high G+C Gram-positive bacteria) TaxID=192944 RepID=UPI003644DA53